jgi:hypothetical protein
MIICYAFIIINLKKEFQGKLVLLTNLPKQSIQKGH